MESIGRWVDLAADSSPRAASTTSVRCLEDLEPHLGDAERDARERARRHADRPRRWRSPFSTRCASCVPASPWSGACCAIAASSSDFTTTLESTFVKGDSNALFDMLVGIVRNAAETNTGQHGLVRVQLNRRAGSCSSSCEAGARSPIWPKCAARRSTPSTAP